MKFSTAACLLSVISSANVMANELYVLTESNQSSSVLFEKAQDTNTTEGKYELTQNTTDDGTIEYRFTPTVGTTPEFADTWYLFNIHSNSTTDAHNICASQKLGGVNWRSPSEAEVDGAMKNYDAGFHKALATQGSSAIVWGYIDDKEYFFSNGTNQGAVMNTMHSNSQPTLCIQQ